MSLFEFLLFICFVEICFNNVFFDGHLLTNWFRSEHVFKVDIVLKMLMVFFSKCLG